MKILVDARPLCIRSPGGVTRITRQFLDELFLVDQKNTYVLGTTGSRRPTLPWKETSRQQHHHWTIPNKIVTAFSALGLLSFEHWFRSDKPDILFLPNLGHVGIPTIPYVLLVHDLTFLIEPRWYPWRGQVWHRIVHATKLLKGARTLVTISEHTKRDLIRILNIPEERIMILPFQPILPGFVKELPPPVEGKRYIMTLGGRDRRKNAGASIRAWQTLRQEKEYQDVELVVVGGEHSLIAGSVPQGIHAFDHPTDDAMATLYKHAAVFLYPSWAEGYGIPLHEAARFGTPCIGGSGSVLEETMPTGTMLIPPEKPHVLAEAIRLQLTTPRATELPMRRTDDTACGTVLMNVFDQVSR